jgi:hypothetical protein
VPAKLSARHATRSMISRSRPRRHRSHRDLALPSSHHTD